MECGQLTGPCSSGSTHSRCLTSTWRKPTLPARMATIRDVVEALSRSNGVDAVVVVGRDGLPIDSRVANGVDAVSVARTLSEARSALRANPATDGLLLDIHLPDGSGLDFLRDLRKQGGTARLPVLVLTAEGEDRILREAHRLGAGLVTKPFSPSKLSQRIALMFGDVEPEGEAS